MTPPTLTIPVVDLTEADEFDLLSVALQAGNALDLTDAAISHLRAAAASAQDDSIRHRLRDATDALERTHMLVSAVLNDIHQAATDDQRARA